jgi:uncharacterized protein YacL
MIDLFGSLINLISINLFLLPIILINKLNYSSIIVKNRNNNELFYGCIFCLISSYLYHGSLVYYKYKKIDKKELNNNKTIIIFKNLDIIISHVSIIYFIVPPIFYNFNKFNLFLAITVICCIICFAIYYSKKEILYPLTAQGFKNPYIVDYTDSGENLKVSTYIPSQIIGVKTLVRHLRDNNSKKYLYEEYIKHSFIHFFAITGICCIVLHNTFYNI